MQFYDNVRLFEHAYFLPLLLILLLLLLLPPLLLPLLLQIYSGDWATWNASHVKLSTFLIKLVAFMLAHLYEICPALPDLPRGFGQLELQHIARASNDEYWQQVGEALSSFARSMDLSCDWQGACVFVVLGMVSLLWLCC